ncbi:S9 family peptidase [Portibacter marinus]|uniref:S9 family peptidase n=1 Tax=Portibacter marinus TaxID=2898660 RepID=UPI001F1B1210|nr:prolyl oligopeptidase family serine peptidase [Portibacter marinus]
MYRLILLIAALLVVFSPNHLSGQDQPLLREIMSYTMPSSLTAGHNTEQVFWIGNKEGARNIYFYDGSQTLQLTSYSKDDGQDITALFPKPTTQDLIYFRGGSPNRQGDIPNPTTMAIPPKRTIFQINLQTKAIDTLGEGYNGALSHQGQFLVYIDKGNAWLMDLQNDNETEMIFNTRGGISDFTWSPDDSKIAFVSSRGDHGYIGIYDLSDQTVRFLGPSVDSDSNPAWSPDGQKIAFLRLPSVRDQLPFIPVKRGYPWRIMVADLESEMVEELWKADEETGSVFRNISAENQIFWGAGDHIVFPWEKNGYTNLYSIHISDRVVKPLAFGNFEVQFASLSKDGRSIFYSSNEGDIDRQHIWFSEVDGTLKEQVTSGQSIEWSPVSSGANVFFLTSDATTPAHPAQIKSGNSLAIDAPLKYPSEQLVIPHQVIFPAADGKLIHGQLFLPQDLREGDQRPAIIFFHGGSKRQMLLGFHHRGYYHNAYAFNQFLASKGYIVLSVNYRSGIGYGMEFREADNYGASGASEFNDVLGAGLYLKNRSDVEGTRIGLWGGSYGGYLTALGLSRAPYLFKVGVDIHGVHDWNPVIQNFVPSYDPLDRPEVSKLAYESSPMAFINGWKAPTLFIHGDDDRNVPFSETVEIIELLRNQNVEIEQLVFPDEVHGFLLHQNWISAYEAAFDFFERRL